MLDGMPPSNKTPTGSSIGPNITIEHATLRFRGGGTAAGGAGLDPPHPPRGWSKTGPWPSWGWFVRRTVGVTFRNLELDFDLDDGRPAICIEDAANTVLENSAARRGRRMGYDVLVRHGCPGLKLVGGNLTTQHEPAP